MSFVPQTKNATNEGVCETLMLDVLALETQQNNRSYMYVSSADLVLIYYATLAWWRLHEGPQKITKLSKLGGGHFPRMGACKVNVLPNCN